MKLFGVIHNETHGYDKIWLIKAENVQEARSQFYRVMRHEKIPPPEEVRGPNPDKGEFQIWEVEFDENYVSSNDLSR